MSIVTTFFMKEEDQKNEVTEATVTHTGQPSPVETVKSVRKAHRTLSQ